MEAGYSNEVILAGAYGVSRRTVESMRHSFNCYSLVCVPLENTDRRPSALNDLHIAELHEYLLQRPSAYFDEMAYFFLDEFDRSVSEATLHRMLKRSRWSRKIQRKVAAQRNMVMRNHWLVSVLPKYRPEQLILWTKALHARELVGE